MWRHWDFGPAIPAQHAMTHPAEAMGTPASLSNGQHLWTCQTLWTAQVRPVVPRSVVTVLCSSRCKGARS